MSVRPRRLSFRGRHPAAGVVVAPGHARRAVTLWEPGTRVDRTVDGELLVRFGSPRDVVAEAAPGAIFTVQGEWLVGCPLSEPERAQVAAAPGTVLRPLGGSLVTVETAGEVDLSEWLDVAYLEVAEVAPLPPPVAPVVVVAPPPRVDLRAGVGRDEASAKALVEALTDAGVTPRPPWWRRALKALARRGAPRPPKELPGPSRRGWLDRAGDRLARALAGSAPGRWLAARQADYLQRLFRMFDEDELERALRHAIPLTSRSGTGAAPALMPPSPRERLVPSGRAPGAPGRVYQLGGDAYEQLRARYRAAAAKLEEEGRIDEAAFVLADLLEAPREAVALLERHGRFAPAADLAESRQLGAELAVRLRFLAGDLPRAVALARKARVFGPAVAHLEKSHPAAAARLRLLWADHLASSGDHLAAVRVAQALPDAQALVLRWIDLGIEHGGPGSGELIVRRLGLDPSGVKGAVERAVEGIEDPSPDRHRFRVGLAEALLSAPAGIDRLALPLRRGVTRALIRDEGALGPRNQTLLRRLLDADEGPLRADVPPLLPGTRPTPAGSDEFPADRAALVPFDAVRLPAGRLLVALGESGLRAISAAGRTLWAHPAPAQTLAGSTSAASAMAVVQRDEALEVMAVGVPERQVRAWPPVRAQAAAGELEEGVWFVAADGMLLGLDTFASTPAALWQVPWRAPGQAGRALAVAVGPQSMAMLSTGPLVQVERRVYRLPDLELRIAGELFPRPGRVIHCAVAPAGTYVLTGVDGSGRARAWYGGPAAGGPEQQLELAGQPTGCPAASTGFVGIPELVETGVLVHVLPVEGVARMPPLRFPGARAVRLRWDGGLLVCVADSGVIVQFDVAQWRAVGVTSVRVDR